MVLEIALEGAAIFVGGIASVVLGYTAMFAFQTTKEMKDSATEKKITEQLADKQ